MIGQTQTIQNSRFELCVFENGTHSLKDLVLGEAMHSSLGPWQEAWQLYIQPSGILDPGPPLVIYDVGLGCATNAIAALKAAQSANRHVTLISFERFPETLQKVIEADPSLFPYVSGYEDSLRTLLNPETPRVETPRFSWQIEWGDLTELSLDQLPSPDLIFYDFFSPKVSPELWTPLVFKKLFQKSHPSTLLLTYCSARIARDSLWEAGFRVGNGPSTSKKRTTTQASPSVERLNSPIEHHPKPL